MCGSGSRTSSARSRSSCISIPSGKWSEPLTMSSPEIAKHPHLEAPGKQFPAPGAQEQELSRKITLHLLAGNQMQIKRNLVSSG